MHEFQGWGMPQARSTGMAPATALIVISDPRLAVSVTLVLQEMGYAVDQGADSTRALRWLRRSRYDLVVASAIEQSMIEYLIRLRYAASEARIILLADAADVPDGAEQLRITVLPPSLDVNVLVDLLRA